jgi:hypothetical protein
VRLIRLNLEESWLPLVDAIHDSTAMREWTCSNALGGGPTRRAIVELVTQFGAVSRWVDTLGLDHVADERLVDRLVTSAGRLDQAVVSGDGDLGVAISKLGRLARETARRISRDSDGDFTAVVWERLGSAGFDRLLDALDSLGELDRHETSADGLTPGEIPSLQQVLGTVVAPLAATHERARDALIDRATMSPALADVVARDPEAFGPAVVTELAAELVAFVAGVGRWRSVPRVVDLSERAGALLEVVTTSPLHALDLLTRDEVGPALVTSDRFEDEIVEGLVVGGLGTAPSLDPERLADAFGLFGSLVRLAGETDLNTGTRRGVALGSGTFLPAIAVQLDPQTEVVPVLPSSHGAVEVPLGSYTDVSRLMGQVLDDEAAQLTLGVVIASFRMDQIERSVSAIRERPHLGVAETGDQLTASLADVGRVVELLEHARRGRDQLLALQHGMAQARATNLVSLLGLGVSWLVPTTVPLARQVNSLSTRVITMAIGRSRPATTPRTGLEGELAVHATRSMVEIPLRAPDLRRQLGLHGVPASTWNELEALLAELDDEPDPERRGRLHARIKDTVSANPDLDAYAEGVRLRSGR